MSYPLYFLLIYFFCLKPFQGKKHRLLFTEQTAMPAEDKPIGGRLWHDDLENQSHGMNESDYEPFLAKQATPVANKNWWARSAYFYILDVFLIAIAILAFFSRPRHHQQQGDATGYVPAFGSHLVVFENHPEFMSNHSSEASLIEARESWKTLVPRKTPQRILSSDK